MHRPPAVAPHGKLQGSVWCSGKCLSSGGACSALRQCPSFLYVQAARGPLPGVIVLHGQAMKGAASDAPCGARMGLELANVPLRQYAQQALQH